MEEVWKTIEGFNNHYSVSTLGRVRRDAPGKSTKSGNFLKPRIRPDGYTEAHLSFKNISKLIYIQRLVAIAFIGKPDFGFEVNHKDGDKKNNRLDNLEYVTRKTNIIHAIKNGLRHNCSKLKKEDVLNIRRLIKNKIKTMNEIASIYKISPSAVSNIKNRKTWSHI